MQTPGFDVNEENPGEKETDLIDTSRILIKKPKFEISSLGNKMNSINK